MKQNLCLPLASKMFRIQHFQQLDSTNDYIKDHYAMLIDHQVVVCDVQTRGRGRFDRVWESGNDLTCSFLFKSAYAQNLIAPLVVVKALESIHIKASIKWPNDILINGQKVCGILIERVHEGNLFACDVVGIGINLSEKKDTLAKKACYVHVSAPVLLQAMLSQYEDLLSWDMERLIQAYRNVNYLQARKIELDDVLWIVEDINERGYLMIRNSDEVRYLGSEEISLQQIYRGDEAA